MPLKIFISGLIIVFFINTKLTGNSNDGTPYITNIKYIDNQQNFVWCVEQTFRGTMLVAGKTGLLEFDSENWSLIEVPNIAFALKTSENNSLIYVGGRNFIGYLSLNINGLLSYNSLISDSLSQGNFNKIIETKTNIFFYSTHSIVCIEKATKKIIKTWKAGNNLYLGIFNTGSAVYLNIVNEGLFEIRNTELVKINADKILNKSIVFCAKYSDEKSLIGTDDGDLFLFNGSRFEDYTINDQEFINTGILSDGVFIDENNLALSTMNFGVLIVDKKIGKTRNTINYNGGLPNDFIMDLCVDSQNGLWMAHSMGLSRIDTRLPMTNFSSYPGLTSSIVSINYWNDKLFAATSNGVFILDSINRYTSKEIFERVPVKSSPVNRTISADNKELEKAGTEIAIQEPDKKQRKGFLKRLFTKEESKGTDMEKSDQNKNLVNAKDAESIKTLEPEQKYEYLKYNQYSLKSKDYSFNQLSLINKKCKQLIPLGNQLIAVSDANLYSIDRNNDVREIFNTSHIYAVVKSKYNNNQIYVVTENGIYQGVLNKSKWEFNITVENTVNFNMTDVIEVDKNNLLIAIADDIVLYSLENDSTSIPNIYNPYSERIKFKTVNDKKYLLVGEALYSIYFLKGKEITFERIDGISIINSIASQDDNLWIRTESNSFRYFGKAQMPDKIFSFLSVFENVADIQIDNKGNIWVVDNFENIYKLNTSDFEKYNPSISVIIKEIKTQSGEFLPRQNVKLNYSDNALTFEVVSPSYLKFNSSQYQYIIEGLMNSWSDWSNENIISVPFLPPGSYTFKVKAKNLFGEISEIEHFEFKITPPFWRTIYFYVFCILLVVLGFHYRQKYKLRMHIQEKEILQQKVKERTIELEMKNKSITDSIIYAERMQRGILPTHDLIKSYLKEFFILYNPKNYVSGDFYWISKNDETTYIVAADCTGHGVPGAFMSMLGIAYLNEILSKTSANTSAAEILEKLRERIINLFSQETFITNDGIDLALLIIDSTNKKVQYAGAYNPLYQITTEDNNLVDKDKVEGTRDGNILLVYKADKFHVGKASRNFRKFTNHIIPYYENDTFYIFSDGYVDQFGGIEDSKFMFGPFRNLILEIADKPMETQKEILQKRLDEWKGETEQTDDILIWGLKPQ